MAAQGFAPISPTRTAVLYVENTREIADRLGLKPVDEGGNVLLIEPYDPVVFRANIGSGGPGDPVTQPGGS